MFGFDVPSMGMLIAFFLFVALPGILWLVALVDILRSEFTGNNKLIWLLMVIFIPYLGFLLYFIIGRKQKLAA